MAEPSPTNASKEAVQEADNTPKLEGSALESALQNQIEFYFSKENLSKDAFLNLQMNAQKYINVDVIFGFRKIQNLTQDKDLMVSIMKKCKSVELDETGTLVRPVLKVQRATLILRDIPAGTTEEEVKGIFDFEGAGTVVSVRSDVDDCWFVVFENETQCMDTAMELTSRTFKGNPIRARVKSENVMRGFYFPGGDRISRASAMSDTSGVDMRDSVDGFGGGNPYYNPYANQYTADFARKGRKGKGKGGKGFKGAKGERGDRGEDREGGKEGGKRGGKNRREGGKGKGDRRGKGRRNDDTQDDGEELPPEPAFGNDDFPALPTTVDGEEIVPAPPGYQGKFKQYTREEMADVCAGLSSKGFDKPPGVQAVQKHNLEIFGTSHNADSQLLEPMPVMYPASPSPLLAAQPHHSSQMPLLDLNHPFLPPEYPDFTAEKKEADTEAPPEIITEAEKEKKEPAETSKPAAAAAAAPKKSGGGSKKYATKADKPSPNKGKRAPTGGRGSSSGGSKKAPAAKAAAPAAAAAAAPGGSAWADMLKK